MLRFDTNSLRRAGEAWWADELWRWKFILPPLVIAISTAAILVGGDRLREELRRASADRDDAQSPWPFLVAHLVGFALFAGLTAVILEGGFATSTVRGAWIAAWLTIAIATLACWGLCAFPPRLVAVVARRTGPVLATGVVVGAAAWAAGLVTETWWDPLREWTIALVGAMIRVIAPDPVIDAPNLVVGTERFSVRILSKCSGYEGIGLVWVFLGAYLWIFRRDLRFPRAFLLIPIGTVAVWLANAFRLTALIAIGTWISPTIAIGGFHTYSGSLLFSAVALVLIFGVRRSRFFSIAAAAPARVPGARHDPSAAYLLPFLVIIAAGMLTGVVSVGAFDAGYPLRVVAAAGVLWAFRDAYHELRPTWSWAAIAYGVAAFALWMGLEPAAENAGPDLGAALRDLPAPLAASWLAFRVLGSVVTVPIAEELAFRGYVARRLVDADFQRVSLQRFSWVGLIGSSVLFGAMHSRIIAGTLAGVLYVLCARRRGELTDAIVAHATTNALIAAYVFTTGGWSLWT
jgi:exosortase E/protease (VPEID-CTERM system)